MLKAKYQCELSKLKVEEKCMISIADHIQDQINRLKVEEMALKSQIQEITPPIEKEPQPEKSDDEVDINSVPLNLGINYMHNEDDDDDEEDDDDDDDADVRQLSNQLDQLDD